MRIQQFYKNYCVNVIHYYIPYYQQVCASLQPPGQGQGVSDLHRTQRQKAVKSLTALETDAAIAVHNNILSLFHQLHLFLLPPNYLPEAAISILYGLLFIANIKPTNQINLGTLYTFGVH